MVSTSNRRAKSAEEERPRHSRPVVAHDVAVQRSSFSSIDESGSSRVSERKAETGNRRPVAAFLVQRTTWRDSPALYGWRRAFWSWEGIVNPFAFWLGGVPPVLMTLLVVLVPPMTLLGGVVPETLAGVVTVIPPLPLEPLAGVM